MRRLLGLDPDAPRTSPARASNTFPTAIAISAVRCLLTYIVLPLLGPTLRLSGGVGPVLGLALGAVSLGALVVALRRFFASDHRLRWRYSALVGAVGMLVIVQAAFDVAALVG